MRGEISARTALVPGGGHGLERRGRAALADSVNSFLADYLDANAQIGKVVVTTAYVGQ